MTDDKQAILNGIATTTMQEMLRKGELFKLPSSLSHFIANKGWEAVEYIEPESGAKRVAHFELFTDWVTASPARAGLGTRLDLLLKLVSQPLDVEAAPECCKRLMGVLPELDQTALAPMIAKAAAANAELTGNNSWNDLKNTATQAVKRNGGGQPGNQNAAKSENDRVHCSQSNEVLRPAGNSAAAGLRKLRRYAGSESLCSERGLDQESVSEQYGKTLRGEKSVHRALIDCGLKKKSTASAGLGIDGPADDVAARIIKRLGKAGAAALAAALTNQLTND
jgi:hypothetical protein